MRTNLPVTHNSYSFPPDQTLVSVTDLKGRIVYCNPAFVEVSGFTREELLGQPHNLVRHPDMPEEAFRDMWDTIKSKFPWTGMVKNRRKNGDHYWVKANATPMLDGSEITGYLSVRTSPTTEDIIQAESLYAQMKKQAEMGKSAIVMHRGKVVESGVFAKLNGFLENGAMVGLSWLQVGIGALILIEHALGVPTFAMAVTLCIAAFATVSASWKMATAPMESLVLDANYLAAGDLSHVIETGGPGMVGQLQQALNQMSVNLRTVVSDVRSELDQLSVAAREIAEGNMDLSERTESQAASLEETAASMEEIHSTVQISSDSAARGYGLAMETKEISDLSNEAVASVSESMDGIAQSSSKISDIIHLIESIAFQTNILALNAAVEAARAGEQGRGFAVVATEVRSLARRTSTAAKEIKVLITDSSERITAGTGQAGVALQRMRAALDSVSKVGTVLQEISASSVEQSAGIAQINEAIAQIDTITQQNAAMVEELAATATSLNDQVDSVGGSMRLFRLKRGESTIAQADAVDLRRENKLLSSQ